jgi:hypothetical protein
MPSAPSAVPTLGEWPSSKRRKGLNTLSDLQAWKFSDQEIAGTNAGLSIHLLSFYLRFSCLYALDAARETWRSPAYDHYDVKVLRIFDLAHDPPTPHDLVFHFSCKYSDTDHLPHSRGRTKTGSGTMVLLERAKECDKRRSVVSTASADDSGTTVGSTYSKKTHQALLALWSAHSHRSFDSLTDKFHQMEVEYLRPGTKLPASVTISRDVKTIHIKFAPKTKEYFQVSLLFQSEFDFTDTHWSWARLLRGRFTLQLMDGLAWWLNHTWESLLSGMKSQKCTVVS